MRRPRVFKTPSQIALREQNLIHRQKLLQIRLEVRSRPPSRTPSVRNLGSLRSRSIREKQQEISRSNRSLKQRIKSILVKPNKLHQTRRLAKLQSELIIPNKKHLLDTRGSGSRAASIKRQLRSLQQKVQKMDLKQGRTAPSSRGGWREGREVRPARRTETDQRPRVQFRCVRRV